MDSTGCDKSRTNAEVDRIFFHLHYIQLPRNSDFSLRTECSLSLDTFAFLLRVSRVLAILALDSPVTASNRMGSALASCKLNTLHFLVLVDPLKEYRHGSDNPRAMLAGTVSLSTARYTASQTGRDRLKLCLVALQQSFFNLLLVDAGHPFFEISTRSSGQMIRSARFRIFRGQSA
ncbi:hypothetical protein F5890DRAFT_1558499 [Lentinula detonsa]|uniref:Uncharacterized protein n=1 Tax=Lentinula detonsa TaxID=2804962 RepID=A0AA38PQ15_9AGAR|nr:hypothetical protein F5890DRAFT_1558499 [Lentinula detonsa]